MFHRWPALVLVLVFCAATPRHAAGQQEQTPQHPGAGKLGNSWPNPFNPDVNIPFTVGGGSCASGEQHAVSVRILNILAQPVAVPILTGPSANSTSSSASSLNGSSITNLSLACGDYVAFWKNGKLTGGGREAASGTYIIQILVDGKLSDTKRIYYRK
jgi:hypothetical protein